MHKNLLLGLALVFLSLSSTAQLTTTSLMHNGVNRTYSIYVPANYNANIPVPLILNFHGFGGNNLQQMANGDFRPIADTAGFIVVCPLGTLLPTFNLPHWNVGSWTIQSTTDDLGFTAALIDSISAQYSIDEARVYATGFSNGGFFSHKLAMELSDRFAAIASVSGSFSPEMYANPNPTHPMPVLQIHGTNDGTVSYTGSTTPANIIAVDTVINYWVNFNNCNSTPTITSLPDLNTSDGSTVEHYVYAGGDNGVRVELMKINGGGHTWPGNIGANRDIDACSEIWKFFNSSVANPTNIVVSNFTQQAFTIYPNPSKGLVYVDLNLKHARDYQVLSISGQEISKGQLSITNNKIDFTNQSNGIYFLKVGTRVQSIEIMK